MVLEDLETAQWCVAYVSLHNEHKPRELVSQSLVAPPNCLEYDLQVIWSDVGEQSHFWLKKHIVC